MYNLKTQKMAFKNLRQHETNRLSSYFTSNENILASIFIIKNREFIKQVNATLPEWKRVNLCSESQQGEPSLKYHTATDDDNMKLLQPLKKKIVQRQAAIYTHNIII